jgi:hypothetical protein
MSTIEDKTKDIAKKMLNLDQMQHLVSSTPKLTIAIGCIILFIVGGFIYWNYSLSSIPNKRCSIFQEAYINQEARNATNLTNSNFADDGAGCAIAACPTTKWSTQKLTRSTGVPEPYLSCYRVKTAYNCCALTNFQNTYVNICALEACIAQGYRALDFEVYLIDGKAQIAVSSKSSVHVKTSYNAIPCTKVFNAIKYKAFSTKHCPNPADPLIIILRIKSNHVACHNSIAAAIETTIKDDLLDPARYGKECRFAPNLKFGINSIPVSIFKDQKIIVIVDDSVNDGKLLPASPPTNIAEDLENEPATQSNLWKYTHGTVGADNKQVSLITYSDLTNSTATTEIEKAKNKLTIVFPEYSPNANSIPIIGDAQSAVIWYGSQLSGTCNQSVLDPVKIANDNYFKTNNRSWIMREPAYLPTGQTTPAPSPPPPNTLYKINVDIPT